MRLPNRLPRLARAAMCLTAASVYPSISADDETAPDPWFSQDLSSATQKEEEAHVGGLSHQSPRAIAKQLIASYDVTPEGDLSKRISLLEEAISIQPNKADDLKEQLAELHAIRAEIDQRLDQANANLADLLPSLRELSPYAKYLQGDARLLFKLLESPFAKQLDIHARSLSHNGRYDELKRLQDAIQEAGLTKALGSQVTETANASLARQILRQWQQAAGSFSPLPGETYLVRSLLGLPDARIPLSVEYPQGIDPKLARNISRSIERDWNSVFQIVPSGSHIAPKADLILKIEAEPIDTSISNSEKAVASSVPGHVVEEPNPDFMALAKKYQKAADSYEIALRTYEANYQRYIEQFEQGEWDYAQSDLKSAKANFESTPPNSGPNGPSAEYLEAEAQYKSAQALASSISPSSLPEPQKPIPYHHELLEELYLMPSTIVTSEEASPYEYTAENLEYAFSGKARVDLQTRADSTPADGSVVTLKQVRNWTKNLGVHPKDPTVDDGNFSQDNIDSALDIFTLEFGARCSKELVELVKQTVERLGDAAPDSHGLPLTLTRLALESTQPGGPKQSLTQQELAQLAELARTPGLEPHQFRLACLKLIMAKSPFPSLADEKRLAELL